MKKTKTVQSTVYYIPTLLDRTGVRHIIPGKDSPSYCGATGSQHFPHDHKACDLCQRCLQVYLRTMVLEERLTRFGL